jgi:AraC-like DNA-binding protein
MNDETFNREQLNRAREFIDTCYNLPLDLDQISSQASFSRYHFIRLFRIAYEQTPHQYLIQKRIEKAKDLLASSEMSVTEICFAVGFQSLGSFSALFRRCVGHPPKAYRARMLARHQPPRPFVPACFLTMFGVERSATA